MIVEFWANGGKKPTDKIAEMNLDYVPQLSDIIWLGEPDPNRYVVSYRDFVLRGEILIACIILR